jgi:outer membrane autotransporter protein
MKDKQKKRALKIGIMFSVNVFFCPIIFAATATAISTSGTRASLNSINAKIENRFVYKQIDAANKNVSIHDLKPYESEPMVFGTVQRQKADVAANITGYRVKNNGVGYLFDYNFPTTLDLFEMGGGVTYSESHSKIGIADTLSSEYRQMIGYTNLINNGYFLGLFLSGSESQNKSKRIISNNALEARARFKGNAFFSKIRAGFMSRHRDWQFTPEASLQYVHINQKGYNETGADTSNLSVNSSGADGVKAGIGGRIIYIQPSVTTEIRLFYLRDLKNPLLKPTYIFSASGAPFLSGAQNNKKNTINLGTSLKYFLRNDLSIAGNYDFLAKKQGYTENNISLSMCLNF